MTRGRLTVKQAAGLVGVPVRTVRSWCPALACHRLPGGGPAAVRGGPWNRWELDRRAVEGLAELVRLRRLAPQALPVLLVLRLPLPPPGFTQRVAVWLDRLCRLHVYGTGRHLDKALRFQARHRGWGKVPPRKLTYWAWRATKGARVPVAVRLAIVYATLESSLVRQLQAGGTLPGPEEVQHRSCSWAVSDSRERRRGVRRLPPELVPLLRRRHTPGSW
jgi:hypothetical protein